MLLLAATEVAMPVYVQRYVAYCLLALALPVGIGLAAIAVAPRVIALLLITGLGLSTQFAQRQADGHGDDIHAAADIITAHERPGDGVLYDCPSCRYPNMPREFAFGYPAAFGPLDDLGIAKSPSASGTLRGTKADRATLRGRLDGVSRVWLVETGGNTVPAAWPKAECTWPRAIRPMISRSPDASVEASLMNSGSYFSRLDGDGREIGIRSPALFNCARSLSIRLDGNPQMALSMTSTRWPPSYDLLGSCRRG